VLKARQLAQDAIELSPESSQCYHALGMAYWFMGNIDSSLSAFQAGLEINPNDTEIMADLGFRYALLAKWDKALPLLEPAIEQDPFQPGTYRVALSLFHLAHGRYAESLLEARRVVAPDVLYGHVLCAVGAAHLGYKDEAQAAVNTILAINPNYRRDFEADLRKRNVNPRLIRLLAGGLAKAGLVTELSGQDNDEALADMTPAKSPNLRTIGGSA
jgi:tetratricopeptide (TPR) repeat protein